jgi:bacterioferritin-associated ferredoxin
MIVCSCNVLSETAVRSACHERGGPRSLGQVYRCLGCSPQCGRCARTIRTILDQSGICPSAAIQASTPVPPQANAGRRLAEAAE